MLNWLKEIDYQLFTAINGSGTAWQDNPMIWLSNKLIWIPLYALLLFFLIKKMGWKFYVPVIGIILIITICDQFTSSFMKPFFERLRPCHDPFLAETIRMVKGCGGKYGFASSHAANSFGLATFFHLIFKNKYTLLLLIWAFLVSYSRVYLGAHFAGDVLVGGILGSLIAYMIYQIMIKSGQFKEG